MKLTERPSCLNSCQSSAWLCTLASGSLDSKQVQSLTQLNMATLRTSVSYMSERGIRFASGPERKSLVACVRFASASGKTADRPSKWAMVIPDAKATR